MISKSIIVFWSVTCLTLFFEFVRDQPDLTFFFILAMGFTWALVILPTALIGHLFKSQKVYSTKMRWIRGGVLTAIGLMTFVVVNASQQPKQWYAGGPPGSFDRR